MLLKEYVLQMTLNGRVIQQNFLKFSTIDTPPGVTGVSKNPKDQTEDHVGKLER